MYYYIKGTLALLAGDTAVIDAGGIGYRLTVTQNTFAALASKLGKEAQLFTYLAVRDDAMELYGFASEDEKLFFTKLLPCVLISTLAQPPIYLLVKRIAKIGARYEST